jgi:hypothetical protein
MKNVSFSDEFSIKTSIIWRSMAGRGCGSWHAPPLKCGCSWLGIRQLWAPMDALMVVLTALAQVQMTSRCWGGVHLLDLLQALHLQLWEINRTKMNQAFIEPKEIHGFQGNPAWFLRKWAHELMMAWLKLKPWRNPQLLRNLHSYDVIRDELGGSCRCKKWSLESRRAYQPRVLWKAAGERHLAWAHCWGFTTGAVSGDPRWLSRIQQLCRIVGLSSAEPFLCEAVRVYMYQSLHGASFFHFQQQLSSSNI